MRARWPLLSARIGYPLQKATGVVSTAFSDSISGPDEVRREFPLAFDRRHAANFAIMAGAAAGMDARWSAVLTGSLRSGYPLDRGADTTLVSALPEYLPWTSSLDLRVAYNLGALPVCGGCNLRLLADARNLLGRDNILALRRSTGLLAPSPDEVEAMAAFPALGVDPLRVASLQQSDRLQR